MFLRLCHAMCNPTVDESTPDIGFCCHLFSYIFNHRIEVLDLKQLSVSQSKGPRFCWPHGTWKKLPKSWRKWLPWQLCKWSRYSLSATWIVELSCQAKTGPIFLQKKQRIFLEVCEGNETGRGKWCGEFIAETCMSTLAYIVIFWRQDMLQAREKTLKAKRLLKRLQLVGK